MAIGPIDYITPLKQPDISDQLLQGLQLGGALKAEDTAKRAAEQYSADLQSYLTNPTARGAAAMTAKYPKQREAFKQSWDIQSQGQKDSLFNAGTQVYSAIKSGRPDLATRVIDEQIAAMENAGEDAGSLKAIREGMSTDPKGAAANIAITLSSVDPDKWGKIAGEERESDLAPSALTESQAKAQKAAVDAKFAESKAAQDLTKGGWDIAKIQNDIGISRQNSQIAALNANISREKNDLKRQEMGMKLQEKIDKRDAELRSKTAEVSSGRSTIDNFLSTADSVLKTPADVVGSATGTISSILPTVGQDVADFEETLKTLSSQAFLSQVPAMKGLGALTEAEGKKLEASLANLSLRQSPEKLLSNVQEAQRLMLKARSNLSDKYGVPDVIPDRPQLESQPSSSGFRVLGPE